MNPTLAHAATRLKTKAEAALNADRQTNTARRADMAAGIAKRASIEVARAELAARIALADDLPECLRGIKNMRQIEMLDRDLETGRYRAGRALGHPYPYDRVTDLEAANHAVESTDAADKKRYAGLGIIPHGKWSLRGVLRALVAFRTPPAKEDAVKALERKLVGARIPGFFPTPRDVAKEMVELAGISPGSFVLEPSAGSGRLAEAARDAGGEVFCIELNHTLVELLEAKGFVVSQGDFLDDVMVHRDNRFTACVMNPPFERGQDMAHVKRAFAQLATGGVLVAITSPGPFFRQDAQSCSFRAWFEAVGGEVVRDLPSGTFDHSDVTQRTGVSAKLIRIRARG